MLGRVVMSKSIYGTISPVYGKNKKGERVLYGYKGRKGLGKNSITGRYMQKTFFDKTEEGVRKQMLAYLNSPIDNLYDERDYILVEEWTNYWLENIKLPMLSESSERMYRNMINIINAHIGLRHLGSTSKAMLQIIINSRANEGKNTSFLHTVICQCFREAYECRYLDSDITKGLRYKDKPAAVKIPISKKEDEIVSHYISGKPLENEIIFLRKSACRISEMCGLTWDMVHAEDGYVMIAQQQGDIKDAFGRKRKGIVHTTKNNVFAPVYMPKFAFESLERERKHQMLCAEKNGGLYKNAEGYVFTDEFGQPYSQKQINYFIKKIGNEIGRPELSAHYFRHTRASEVYERTKDPLIVQKLLRHKDLSVTFRYLHNIESYGKEVEKALQEDYEKTLSERIEPTPCA